jgi:chaperonin cofactor prefoldin
MDGKELVDTFLEVLRMARAYPELEQKFAETCKQCKTLEDKCAKLKAQLKSIKSQLQEEEP